MEPCFLLCQTMGAIPKKMITPVLDLLTKNYSESSTNYGNSNTPLDCVPKSEPNHNQELRAENPPRTDRMKESQRRLDHTTGPVEAVR